MDPFSIAAASLGLISVAKDLADIAGVVINRGSRITDARAKLETFREELKALEVLPDVHSTDPAICLALNCLHGGTTALRQFADTLHSRGIRSRLRLAYSDKEVDSLLQAIERAKGLLALTRLIRHADVVEERLALQQQDARSVEIQLQTLQATTSAMEATQRELVVTIVRTDRCKTTSRPWLQLFWNAWTPPSISYYPARPVFQPTLHKEESAIVQTVLKGTRGEVVRLLKSGEAHPGHMVDVGWHLPLYLIAAYRRDLEICRIMLDCCEVDDTVSYCIIDELSSLSRAARDSISTALFRQFIEHTNIDLETDASSSPHWLEEVTNIEWQDYIYQRLLESRRFQPTKDLFCRDPLSLTHCNLHQLMTIHGIKVDSVMHLEQHGKDWLLHAYLCHFSFRPRGSRIWYARWLIQCGADPFSTVHGRMPLAAIFMATNLQNHFDRKGRDCSIFAAWQKLLEEFDIDFSECIRREILPHECYNTLRGHQLQLLDVKPGDMDLRVTWTWSIFSERQMPGTYPTDMSNKVCWIPFGQRSIWRQTTTAEIHYNATLSRLLDNIGYRGPLPSQDDHDWVARTFSRSPEWSLKRPEIQRRGRQSSHQYKTPRRSHSQPRSLAGLAWIPHRGCHWLKGYYICPFTANLQHKTMTVLHENNFIMEMGDCLGLSDNSCTQYDLGSAQDSLLRRWHFDMELEMKDSRRVAH